MAFLWFGLREELNYAEKCRKYDRERQDNNYQGLLRCVSKLAAAQGMELTYRHASATQGGWDLKPKEEPK